MTVTRIVICGDFCAHKTDIFKVDSEVINSIKESNFAICNFEAPIHSGGKAQVKSGPSISQSIKSPEFLENVGFNSISLGNNHIMDFGEHGLKLTISAFKNSTIFDAGTFDNVYDMEWNQHSEYLKNCKTPTKIKKPKGFEKMVEYADALANGHPQMRVDYYNITW